jgi:hypothetical protein
MPVIQPRDRSLRQRGSVLIEASLIMLVALMVIVATFDFGQFLFFHQTLAERARLAARYGALNWDRGCDATCVKNMVVYRQPTVPANGVPADNLVVPGLTTANVNVTIPNPTVQGWDARVIVKIQNYRFKVFTPWLSSTGTMTARALTATSPIEAPN